jgi:NADPH:quinone reductase-like Zn-dependent oxidoreductase
MKAAIVTAAGKTPIYGDFEAPTAKPGEELISVRASALSHLSKSRASGAHYSSAGIFPAIAGTDGVGVTQDGRRVYFVLPETPFGTLAELCPISSRKCIELPASLDDITAAAIANPGMSAWAALIERAHLIAGETVLINGATGTAGRIAIQLARYLKAGKIIATGRNAKELEELKAIGADVVVPFTLGLSHPTGASEFEDALKEVFASGINVVIDYLWGESAKTIITAIVKATEDATPVRFVQVGEAAGESTIDLPSAALRSSSILLMGSGLKSVPMPALLNAIKTIFEIAVPAGLKIATNVVPLSDVEKVWDSAPGNPRLVFSIR